MSELRSTGNGRHGPVPASMHRSIASRRGADAVAMLTVYLVLLFAIPSSVTISALGSLGRPSMLWGIVMLGWWAISRLQARDVDVRPVTQPVRMFFIVLFVIALVSFAAAMLRGQPEDQISPAYTALIRLLSWAGVLFVTIDGVRTRDNLSRLVRRIAMGAGFLALLGIVQFISGQPIVDVFGTIPGLSGGDVDIAARGGLARAPGTATHPLEFATALNASLPLIIAAAISHGFRTGRKTHALRWWVPVGLVSITALLGVSRSAIIGFALAIVSMVPVLPRRSRGLVIVGGVVISAVLVAAVPGLFKTRMTVFTGAGSDPSTQSRTNGLDRAPEFIGASPAFGAGFGTFLPRYYIFDNQWVLIAVELGLLGLAAFVALFAAAIWSALSARRMSTDPDTRLLGYALAASIVTVAVLFAFFDGLSFPISGGLLFMLLGLCASIRTIALSNLEHTARPARSAGDRGRTPSADRDA